MAATSTGQGPLRAALVSACGLLGVTGATARATEVHTALLGYTEPNRVSAFEAVGDVNHEFDNGRSVNFRLVFDALSGASANGATPASFTQTFTSPSGNGSYRTSAGETPLDPSFRDTRVALSAGGSTPLGRLSTLAGGLYMSTEHDYSSLGINGSLSRDFFQKNTTLAVRASYFSDTINPEGGRPTPFATMPGVDQDRNALAGDGKKHILDAGVGLTQVIDKKTVFYAGYTYSDVSGYQTDPYKLLSSVDGVTGDPVEYLFESRPEARTKHILYTRLVRALGRTNLHLSYRYMNDDWGITSNTVEARWRLNLNGGSYLEPHVRWYHQTAADFYRRWLVDGAALPDFASADYRLGDMTDWTWGLLYARPVAEDVELTVRAEYLAQKGESHPAEAFGVLRDYDLFPTVDAYIVQVGFNVSF